MPLVQLGSTTIFNNAGAVSFALNWYECGFVVVIYSILPLGMKQTVTIFNYTSGIIDTYSIIIIMAI